MVYARLSNSLFVRIGRTNASRVISGISRYINACLSRSVTRITLTLYWLLGPSFELSSFYFVYAGIESLESHLAKIICSSNVGEHTRSLVVRSSKFRKCQNMHNLSHYCGHGVTDTFMKDSREKHMGLSCICSGEAYKPTKRKPVKAR